MARSNREATGRGTRPVRPLERAAGSWEPNLLRNGGELLARSEQGI